MDGVRSLPRTHEGAIFRKGKVCQNYTRGNGKEDCIQIDYTMEKHLGENAMLRYVKKKGYARRDEEIMNKNEFLETLAMGLDYLKGFSIAQFLPEF